MKRACQPASAPDIVPKAGPEQIKDTQEDDYSPIGATF